MSYEIIDKHGYVMPCHYSGRNYTLEEAERLVARLNKNGEHKPYTIKKVK